MMTKIYHGHEKVLKSPDSGANFKKFECGSMLWILRLSRYLGVAPLSFNDDSFTTSQTADLLGKLLAAILMPLTIATLILDFLDYNNKSVHNISALTAVVWTSDVILMVFTTFLGVFGAEARVTQILKILETISEVDVCLHSEFQDVVDKKMLNKNIWFIFSSIILLGCDYVSYVVKSYADCRDSRITYMYITYYIQQLILILLQVQFLTIVSKIHTSFRNINNMLNDILKYYKHEALNERKHMGSKNVFNFNRQITSNHNLQSVNFLVDNLCWIKYESTSIIGTVQLPVTPRRSIEDLIPLHGALCDMVQAVNSSYGLVLLALLLYYLIHLIMSPYYVILQFRGIEISYTSLLLDMIWCIYHMVNLIFVVEPCHHTIIEYHRSQEIISRYERDLYFTHQELATQLDMFNRQLLLRSVYYTPFGMCLLDRPLIASIIGGVTTYLVILVQFQSMTET